MMIINDKFPSGIYAGAGAIVFWAAPVTIKGILALEDHQNTYMSQKTLKAVSGILKQDTLKSSDVNGWAIYNDFGLIHSPQWPADPTRNLMILQSNSGATGVNSGVMIESMKRLLALQLHDTLKGDVFVSWPSVMVATGEALGWVDLYMPEWNVYVPEEYVNWDTGEAELNRVSEMWRDIWVNGPSCTRSALDYQIAVTKAYADNIAEGKSKDAALQVAWHIGRNNHGRKEERQDHEVR